MTHNIIFLLKCFKYLFALIKNLDLYNNKQFHELNKNGIVIFLYKYIHIYIKV